MISSQKLALIALVVGAALAILLVAMFLLPQEHKIQLRACSVGAENAYFLLPETYVITDTRRIDEILSEIYGSDHNNGTFWTGDDDVNKYLADVRVGLGGWIGDDSSGVVEEFEEFHEMFIDIDASGNANCRLVMQMPPSKFADILKSLTPLIGIDKAKQNYIESLRGSFARLGLEMDDPSCEIGIDDNFTVTMEWGISGLARWEDNRWTITVEWIDDKSAAKETIAEEDDAWVTIRNVAKMENIESVQYRVSSKTVLILPENAENVYCPLLGSSETIDHGGGSYSMGSLYSENIGGRSVVIENGLTLIVGEKEITLTPEQLIENSLFYSINYGGFSPENVSFVSSLEQVRLDLKYGRELREQYSIYSGGSWYSLTPAQVLYCAAEAIVNYDGGGQFLIQEPFPVAGPEDENGDWKACWENLSRDEYVDLAQTIRDDISSTGKAPGVVDTPIGRLRFRDVLYTFTRILSSYKESELPSTLFFAPVPTGELTWEYNAAKISTDFAEELSNWTNANLTYGLSFSPPTSEEVLVSGKGQCRDYANVYLALTRTAEIPARRVHGWIVTEWKPPPGLWEVAIGETPEGKPIGSHAWTQVFIDGEWVPVDPTWGWFESPAYEIYKQQEQTWMSALAGYETACGLI